MRLVLLCLISLSLLSTGCSWVKFPGVHKVDVQQGNIVDQEMIDKLRPGMTKSRFALFWAHHWWWIPLISRAGITITAE